MEKRPLNEGETRGQFKDGQKKSNTTTNIRPSQPPPAPKPKANQIIKKLADRR